jgi:hypothetical protein
MSTGACYEIAVNGRSRSHRDTEAVAIETATHLKTKNVLAGVTVRDVETVKTLPEKR